MIEISPFLKKLISLSGLAGNEQPVREVIAETWHPLVDELTTSRLGSLHGLRRNRKDIAKPPRILLAAHMDAIGLMVTTISDGFLRFTQVGGIDARILPGQLVTVHGKRDLPGYILQPSGRLLPPDIGKKPVPMRYLFIDTGLEAHEVAELVRPGDYVSFAQQPLEMGGDTLAGHSMDDRAAVAALTVCLDELQHLQQSWDVWAVATVQEEETFGGALTSPFDIRPDLAVAVDVTFAKGPGVSDYRGFPLDKGPTLGWGPNIHPFIYKKFKELAERLDLPYHVEVMPRHSGTDAFGMQVVAEGIPTMVVGIPLRYMHTPVELVAIKDIRRTGHLLAQFIAHLEPDFMSKITWEEKNER